jgi:hypothetical protein
VRLGTSMWTVPPSEVVSVRNMDAAQVGTKLELSADEDFTLTA